MDERTDTGHHRPSLLLRKINYDFYHLVKKLQKSNFSHTAQLTELAYENFLSELRRSINKRRLN